MNNNENRRLRPRRNGALSLISLLLLAVFMAITGGIMGHFSKVPMTLVFLLTSMVVLFTLRGYSIEERVRIYSRGAGSPDLLLMVWIFVLAGAFAKSAQAMGAVSATVDLTLMCLPQSILLAGLFLAACVVSLCVGTSVGTIVALVPVATELAQRTGVVLPLMVAAVVGGAFFGDNLSFISDTTVAATRTQGCSMRDKFRVNFKIVFPAALVCFVVYIFMGQKFNPIDMALTNEVHFVRVLPYLVVLVTALMGCNVLVVLCLGTVLTGIVGLYEGTYSMDTWFIAMSQGIGGMGELILISMMAGGLLAVVRKGGGITYLVRIMTKHIHSRRGAECSISALVALTNCFTANNTVAILSVASIAKDLSERYGVDKRRAASLLDIFSCVMQGVIPYGAQLLMAGGLALISPLEIIQYLYYPFLLAFVASTSILRVRN